MKKETGRNWFGSMRTTDSPELEQANQQPVTFSPSSYHTISVAAKYLMQHRKLRLDLQQLTRAEQLRAIDFLCGILFATQGEVRVIGNHQYLMSI